MIKLRNKRIALLLVLAMLATMFVGVGTASAAGDWVNVESSWTFVQADEDEQVAGDITITPDEDFDASALTTPTSVGVVVTLKTEGVNFTATNSNEWALLSGNQVDPELVLHGNDELLLDIDDGVTGAITVDVRVYGKNGAAYVFDETETQTIAKVDSKATVVAVGAKKTLQIGEDGQEGARITIKEGGPTAFDDPEEVTFSIVTSGVEWDGDGGSFVIAPGYSAQIGSNDTDDKKLIALFDTNEAGAERIALDPVFEISPSVDEGTEIKVKISGDEIDTITVVVGVVGSEDIAVKVTDADEDFVYRGQAATFDDVKVKLNPGGKLDTEWDEEDWFSITLPAGLKWTTEENPVTLDDNSIAEFEGYYDSGRTAWFNVDSWDDETLELTEFGIVADANAVVGDLSVTFDGAVEGTYKIGAIKNAFTVTTTPFALTTGMTGVNGANIVITETADEALVPSEDGDFGYYDQDDEWNEYGWFDIVLPAGVTFVGTPEIEVTDGDLEIDEDSVWIEEDFREIYFKIEEQSSQASTITISGLEYTVLSQPGTGDLKAQVGMEYNIASDKALETLVVGAVSVNPSAVYVIGAPTFTVNGVSNAVVAPSYVKNDRTYLAIRDITTGLGINPTNVMWDEANQRVTMVKGDKIVQVTIGSQTMYVNGVAITMDVAPEMGPTFRTMLPAAFIAQAFGATASWDGLTSTVTIK